MCTQKYRVKEPEYKRQEQVDHLVISKTKPNN